MLHDADLRLKILSALEASDDPEALPLAQLVRDMSSEIEQLTLLLRCPASLPPGNLEPCSWSYDGEQLACSQCGQLATEWKLKVCSVISPEDAAIADVAIPNRDADTGTPSQSPAVVLSTAPAETCNGCGRELKAAEKFCPHCGRTA
jgi:RNA polymerase subunit RPABC4/transcription elongation factor Spt4